MMEFEIMGVVPATEIDEMTAHCMRWTNEKHAIANAIGGRLLIRRKEPAAPFCCAHCFHPEKVFEFRIALPIEMIPKGEGWMIIEQRADELTNRDPHS